MLGFRHGDSVREHLAVWTDPCGRSSLGSIEAGHSARRECEVSSLMRRDQQTMSFSRIVVVDSVGFSKSAAWSFLRDTKTSLSIRAGYKSVPPKTNPTPTDFRELF